MDSVTICNLSLMLVGIPAITSFDENNNNAKLCKTYYPVLRDRVLRDHHWSFATKTIPAQLLHEKSPYDEYPFVCGLPGDVIRIIRLEDNNRFLRCGNKIYVTNHPCRVIYTSRIEDPNLFDGTFVEALQYLIVAEIGLSNSRNTQLMDYYRKRYEQVLATARSIDSQENRFAYQPSGKRSSWIASRR